MCSLCWRCNNPVRTDTAQTEKFSYLLDIFFSLVEEGTIEVISLKFLSFDSLSMTYEYESASFHNYFLKISFRRDSTSSEVRVVPVALETVVTEMVTPLSSVVCVVITPTVFPVLVLHDETSVPELVSGAVIFAPHALKNMTEKRRSEAIYFI